MNRKVMRDLRLFDCQQVVQHLIQLDYARSYFQRERERILAGGTPVIPNCDADFCEDAANDVQYSMIKIAQRIRLNGEPLL